MIFLGFGKFARADKIYAVEPLRGDERGGGTTYTSVGRGDQFTNHRLPHRADDPAGDGTGCRR